MFYSSSFLLPIIPDHFCDESLFCYEIYLSYKHVLNFFNQDLQKPFSLECTTLREEKVRIFKFDAFLYMRIALFLSSRLKSIFPKMSKYTSEDI